jgi:hypothetical protein
MHHPAMVRSTSVSDLIVALKKSRFIGPRVRSNRCEILMAIGVLRSPNQNRRRNLARLLITKAASFSRLLGPLGLLFGGEPIDHCTLFGAIVRPVQLVVERSEFHVRLEPIGAVLDDTFEFPRGFFVFARGAF